MISLDCKKTALVLIDLQNGILSMDTAPYSTTQVLQTGSSLAAWFRAAGAVVVLVNVDFGADFGDAPRGQVDAAMPRGERPDDWADLAEGLVEPGDLLVTKHQWGAFHGTDLDVKLRRRGIDTIVLGGIATNFGVESTLRSGWEHGYNMIVVEDACTSVSEDLHQMAINKVFPRISRIVRAGELNFG
ncbi:hydrolase [Rhizobium deserti]|uniref:Hydrolase n=1 Tax=Rhizobium deserti TaxID=2547961 RepID=A0A4V3APK5_9HYPH|nr:hydrolase [Rhizobium deserti]TDK37255.1 hydrolase [Rhizobium deserti]